ncbi:hypothetical protein [Paenibacillus tyrfis]|uniref:hypothetical protein n=1 Tax=Paenibacillus tyrfis TaxID=1501230 RepID=UPI0020A211D3|nr:hypothetical protein [Paenibacillus tyrfis]MCP1310603.1 hypothetical protein [Paenibacillus tyrfis]
MLTIRVTPQLHHAVHMLKGVDLCKNVNPTLKSLFLSDPETLAVTETFGQSTKTKVRQPKEPLSEWG